MRISTTAPWLLLATTLLATPAFAQDEHCKHSAPRQLKLDTAGAKAIVFDIGHNDLRVDASPGAAVSLQGKACASQADALPSLKLTQERVGDKLVVRVWREGRFSGVFFGNNYAYQTLSVTLPDTLPVQLKVGSGDATVTGAPVLSADVGSGDVAARGIRGLAAVSVGSGDVELDDIGALRVISIGSGDVTARGVRGAVHVGSIGSGEFTLVRSTDDVEIGSIGSGDAELRDVGGDIVVGSVGSGGVEARNVAGALTVRSVGSGDVHHEGVKGAVDLPKHH